MLGQAYRITGRIEEAVSAFKKCLLRGPDSIFPDLGFVGTYGMMGREKEARAEAAEVFRMDPNFSLDRFAKVFPYKDQSVTDNLINALRKAELK